MEMIAEDNQRVVDTRIVHDDITIDMLYCDDTEVIEEHMENYKERAEEYRQLTNWLKELKLLREKERWIPISEKLPNLDDYNTDPIWRRKVLIVGYLSFDDKKDLFISEAFASNVVYNEIRDTVIVAWKPLPELPKMYKIEINEEKM